MYYIYFVTEDDKLGFCLPGYKTKKEANNYMNKLCKLYPVVWIKKGDESK